MRTVTLWLILLLSPSAYGYLPADWMSQIYSGHPNTKLLDIAIPGTHNSATYKMNIFSPLGPKDTFFYVFARPFVAGWAKTQFRSIFEQLIYGIRYFDFRVADSEGKIVIVHGLIAMTLEKVIRQISRFTLEHPREVVLINIAIDSPVEDSLNAQQGEDLLSRANQQFRAQLGKSFREFAQHVTFNDFWSTGSSVMSLRGLKKYWANANTVQKLKDYWERTVPNRDIEHFNDMQLLMTESSDPIEIIKPAFRINFAPGDHNNLSNFSSPLRDVGLQWLRDWQHKGTRFNIVTTDFESLYPFTDTLIDFNSRNVH